MSKDRLDEAPLGSVWCRDPKFHSMREPFAANSSCPGLNIVGAGISSPGAYITLETYVMVGTWFDESHKLNDSWSEPGRSRGFRRWYYLVNYGWIHESNLFGFFVRVI